MKKIIYNDNDLTEKDINRYIYRAKLIIINSNDEILLANSNNNYHIPGGHLEDGETYDECLVREIKEETGIDIKLEERNPFMQIIYLTKDYPKEGTNSKYVANYYYLKCDDKPNYNNMSLTDGEIEENFKLEYINKDKVLDILNDSLENCTRRNVVRDTIDVIKEFLSNY